MKRRPWQIIEDDSFTRAVAGLGGARGVDRAIAPVINGLRKNPEGFHLVPGFKNIYLARTSLRINDLEVTPSHRVWFKLDRKLKQAVLLWVDIAPPEDMGTDGILWSEDDDTL